MRIIFLACIFIFSQNLFSQEKNDDEVMKVVEEMPRFPGCEDLPMEERKDCATNEMLKYIYSNIRYPAMARENNMEGKVVVQFQVGKKGEIIEPTIVRDIGFGCGEEVLRVMELMAKEKPWIPGRHKGEAVKVQYTLPVKFKLEVPEEPPPPYYVFGTDTVYHSPTNFPKFKGGDEALSEFLTTQTIYPESGLDSCQIGSIMAEILVGKDGTVNMLETRDLNQLGTDFLFETIRVIPQLNNKWEVADFEGQPVNSLSVIRIDFKPTNEACKSVVAEYGRVSVLAEEAYKDLIASEYHNGLIKINEALANFPKNIEWLVTQGMIYFGLNQNENACDCFEKIRKMETVPSYQKWIDTVCGF